MVLIQSMYDSLIDYIENKGHATEYENSDVKDDALRTLSLLARSQMVENQALEAVVGFEDDSPRFWNMSATNLIASTSTGEGMNYCGFTTVIVSLILRFTREQFQYYLLTDEAAPSFLQNDGHCVCSASSMFDKAEVNISCLEGLYAELKYRQNLSAEELEKLPFLLVVFGEPQRLEDVCNYVKYPHLDDIFGLLCRCGKQLRATCMLTTRRLEREQLYFRFADAFTCRLAGTVDMYSVKKLMPDAVRLMAPGDERDRKKYIFCDGCAHYVVRTHHYYLGIALFRRYDKC